MSGDNAGTENPLASMIIAEVINRWPETVEVFHRHNMSCVGCPVAPFYIIADAADIYGLTVSDFVAELRQVIPENE